MLEAAHGAYIFIVGHFFVFLVRCSVCCAVCVVLCFVALPRLMFLRLEKE